MRKMAQGRFPYGLMGLGVLMSIIDVGLAALPLVVYWGYGFEPAVVIALFVLTLEVAALDW